MVDTQLISHPNKVMLANILFVLYVRRFPPRNHTILRCIKIHIHIYTYIHTVYKYHTCAKSNTATWRLVVTVSCHLFISVLLFAYVSILSIRCAMTLSTNFGVGIEVLYRHVKRFTNTTYVHTYIFQSNCAKPLKFGHFFLDSGQTLCIPQCVQQEIVGQGSLVGV